LEGLLQLGEGVYVGEDFGGFLDGGLEVVVIQFDIGTGWVSLENRFDVFGIEWFLLYDMTLLIIQPLKTNSLGHPLQPQRPNKPIIPQLHLLAIQPPPEQHPLPLIINPKIMQKLLKLLKIEHPIPIRIEQIQQLIGIAALNPILQLFQQ
jgi:hypothetical protein